MEYYKGIRHAYGVPVEELVVWVEYDGGFAGQLSLSTIEYAHEIDCAYIFVHRKTGEYDPRDRDGNFDYLRRRVGKDLMISCLIAQSGCQRKEVEGVRNEKGRFGYNNMFAYKTEVDAQLIWALNKIGMNVRELAETFGVSKNTIYSRIKQHEKYVSYKRNWRRGF